MIRLALPPRSIRRILLLTALVAAAACSRQGEGERCDRDANLDADCEEGLVCVEKDSLATADVDRCCPPEGSPIGDARCNTRTGNTGSGGSNSGGNTSGGSTNSAGSGATSGEGGAPISSEGGTNSSAGATATGGSEASGGAVSSQGGASMSVGGDTSVAGGGATSEG